MIPFNKPFLTGNELKYIEDAVNKGKISGNGYYTKLCQSHFEKKYGFCKCLLTTSCTDALEMSAILSGINPGDEVIIPSFTFTSTANAFILRDAKIVFADSGNYNPNITAQEIQHLISPKTKAVVIVHYAGVACEMDEIMSVIRKNNLILIEDCAHSIDSYYNNRPLGSFGDFATFSFHETKNINAGEGGLLVVNNSEYNFRSEVIWEKGTNRASFLRGEVNKYEWIDIGSSFLPSELTAAFLYAQLEKTESIQKRRIDIHKRYISELNVLKDNGLIKLPIIDNYATNNGHLFYLICRNQNERDALIHFLDRNGIKAVFHYLPLHQSPYYINRHDNRELPNSEFYSECLLRLPLYYELTDTEHESIIKKVIEFYEVNN
jgi:dTDP-4-amino-4,6-dideoxygalactose transaminase